MRLRDIEWDRVAITAATTILTAALLFVGYKGYEDHLILGQVVGYLNAQAQGQQQPKGPTPNVQSNPEPKK